VAYNGQSNHIRGATVADASATWAKATRLSSWSASTCELTKSAFHNLLMGCSVSKKSNFFSILKIEFLFFSKSNLLNKLIICLESNP